MSIEPNQLAISMAGLGIAIHKALAEAGMGIMEAASALPEGSSAQRRVHDHGVQLMNYNKEVAENISDILALLAKSTKS